MTQKFNVRRTSRPQIYAATVTRLAAMIARPIPQVKLIIIAVNLLSDKILRFSSISALKAPRGYRNTYLLLLRYNVS